MVQHRTIQLGAHLAAPAPTDLAAGDIGRQFPLGEKIPVDFATKSPPDKAGYVALKSVIKLQVGRVSRAARQPSFVNSFVLQRFEWRPFPYD